ncbi:MAG: carbon-nitrogen hydrolase family protein, partial [Clostridia bacterium]|nr:carbon-nitrogen hydrolase family protein [Clostridia bacterium]
MEASRMELKLAAVQMKVTDDKEQNIRTAARAIARLARQGADLVVLPEMFLCPYQTDVFHTYAEPADGPSVHQLSSLAARHQVWLVAGSIPERDAAGLVYNTSIVFDRMGQPVAYHRKAHLFDIDIKGGQYFKESDTLTPGQSATTFETEFGRIGLCICYDFRFPELARRMALDGAKLILVPGAFNQTTGPAHWEVLFRSRAIDNQVYTLG